MLKGLTISFCLITLLLRLVKMHMHSQSDIKC
uniref:Uncharacterized protein n=1 Tax=Anguilla anguilla TaxID=7936 RepID=A0A0E9VE11_ANGAN